ncbi:hypothetical protein [Pedobacter sp. KLB.chiD]|uniref:hypothetical protein n=1 Tax=Pedobacter sp. KLB.chiD TaxID=3387402 RepID=UPI00399B8759
MKDEHDLSEFAAILAAKGYDNSFLTNQGYPDSLEKSLRRYLEACTRGEDRLTENLTLMCYLKWSGEDKPYVQCYMEVKYQNEKFCLTKMRISKGYCGGGLGRQVAVIVASTDMIPEKSNAVRMVDEPRFKNRFGTRMR